VVDAIRCAVEIQRDMAEQNIDVPQVKRVEFRIGIHVGDIIIADDDIFGDGVNIAVRLEGSLNGAASAFQTMLIGRFGARSVSIMTIWVRRY